MEASEYPDSKDDASVDDPVLSSSFSKENHNLDHDATSFEKIIFDFDSCWDDFEARLTVSKMVTDSIIKGMVNAVVTEANDNIALKEKELRLLYHRLQSYEIDSSGFNSLKPLLSMHCHLEMDPAENCFLCATPSAKFKQFNELFFSMKAFTSEQQLKNEVQMEISALIIECYMKDLHTDFEAKLWEQKNHVNLLYKNQQKIVDEFSGWFQELNSLTKLSLTSEHGVALPNNHDIDEWKSINMLLKGPDNHNLITAAPLKENGIMLTEPAVDSPKTILDVVEPPNLKDMTKEEVITYYVSVIAGMRRQHDSVLQEKTEEFYSFKRDIFKEIGALPLRKERDLALMLKQIPIFLSKLDNILLESKNSPSIQDNQEFYGLKNRIDTLFSENQRLQCFLRNKNREVMYLSSKMSDATGQLSQQSSVPESFLRENDELKHQMEDMRIESSINEELHKYLLRDFFEKQRHVFTDYLCDNKYQIEELGIQNSFMQEVFSIIFKGAVRDVIDNANSLIWKNYEERYSLEEHLLVKDNLLSLKNEENENLKKEISSLMEERQNCSQQLQLVLDQHELTALRDETGRQAMIISQQNMELNSVKSHEQEMLKQIYRDTEGLVEAMRKNNILWESLEEAEKENTMLNSLVKEMKDTSASSAIWERENEKAMKCIFNSVTSLSKTANDFQCNFAEVLRLHEFRLEAMTHQCKHLLQQANLFNKKGLLYKQMLELKCSNLQKAETEVDLLGDEVDALLSLLGNIYIALNHYAPVLQHYPGIMEILRLVQRELGGEK